MDPSQLSPAVAAQRRRAEQHLESFVGLTAAEATARAAELDLNVRVIRPGDMVTADFRPARVNAYLDGAGRVRDVRLD